MVITVFHINDFHAPHKPIRCISGRIILMRQLGHVHTQTENLWLKHSRETDPHFKAKPALLRLCKMFSETCRFWETSEAENDKTEKATALPATRVIKTFPWTTTRSFHYLQHNSIKSLRFLDPRQEVGSGRIRRHTIWLVPLISAPLFSFQR